MELLETRQWLSWLIRVRGIIVTFLLGIQLILQQVAQAQGLIVVQVPMKYFLATLVFWYLLDLIFHILYKIDVDHHLQAVLQMVFDSLMITLVVYFTGGLDSFFYFLYPVTILMGSIVLSRSGAFQFAAFCFVQAGTLLLLTFWGTIATYALEESDLRSLQWKIATNLVAFLTIAFLGGKLAALLRKSGMELRDQAGEIEDLRALNQDIIESMRGGLITTDMDGRILVLNGPGAEILNIPRLGLHGQSIEAIIPGLISGVWPELTNARQEIWWKTPPGEDKFLGFSIAPLTRAGETVGYVFNFQDLTQLKKLEREIQMKDRMAAIGRMAAAIAHEIRNPLASIAGSVKLFSGMAQLNQDEQRLIGIVLKESERLNNIVTNFLLYTKEKTYQFKASNLTEILEETLTLLQNHPRVDDSIQINKYFPKEPVIVSMDMDRMRQVFWNLGDNAVKAMPSGGTLSVELQQFEDHVEIQYRDTGVGIHPQLSEKLFEPFQSDFIEGTGLGLAIAFQIVQAHHGTIRTESADRGTIFRIELPLSVGDTLMEVSQEKVHG